MNFPVIKTGLISRLNILSKREARINSDLTARRNELMREIERTNMEMEDTLSSFNNTTEKALIDMYAYQLKALEQKYGYFLSQIKELDTVLK